MHRILMSDENLSLKNNLSASCEIHDAGISALEKSAILPGPRLTQKKIRFFSDEAKDCRTDGAAKCLTMHTSRRREIVIEFEKIQIIRKRAKTTLVSCDGCENEADAVSLAEAADLFETSREELFRFIEQNECHYHVAIEDQIYLCVPSLLESMQRQTAEKRLLATGE